MNRQYREKRFIEFVDGGMDYIEAYSRVYKTQHLGSDIIEKRASILKCKFFPQTMVNMVENFIPIDKKCIAYSNNFSQVVADMAISEISNDNPINEVKLYDDLSTEIRGDNNIKENTQDVTQDITETPKKILEEGYG